MKVVVVTSFPQDPARPHGGVEAVSVQLVGWLARQPELEVHVVTTDRQCEAPGVSQWNNATIHRLPWEGRTVLTHAIGPGRRRVCGYVADLRPDVVHAHDIYGMMVRGLSLPRVFTVHGFIYGDTLVSGGRCPRLRSRIWKHFEQSGWADQPHIISISPYVRERLSGIARGVIHDIDNPVDESFFKVERREQQATIFSAAVINARKNTLTLIEALARLVGTGTEAVLRLAGSEADPGYAQLVRDRVRQQGLSDRVHFLGRIGTDQVREELSRASVFALVSLEENSPMGVEEAMATGVPVVTSNRCGMPYLVRDGESGFLVDPMDPDDIASRLGQLLRNDDLRVRMGTKGREIALDRFHPAKVAGRTKEVYRRAMRDA